jgi:hypothetical protein
MPLYIRRLPVREKHALLDPKQATAQSWTFFNPSRAGSILYIRITDFVEQGLTQKNKVLLYDVETKQSSIIESPWSQLAPTVNMFQGIEDLRICFWKDTLWFAGTTTHASSEMTNELIVGYFNPERTAVAQVCPVDIGSLPVKNVCPFVWKDQLCLWDTYHRCVYRMDPDATPMTAEKILELTVGPGLPTTQYRGSTSPIHLHGSIWGFVAHDIIFNDTPVITFRLSYIHHWIEMDLERGQITFVSQPFFIAHWGIEYVSGIYADPAHPDRISLYFGVDDKVAMECHTTLHELRVGKAIR